MRAAACLGQDPYRVLTPTLALVREGPPPGAPRPTGMRLLDQVRAAIRLRHYSRRTEKAYAGWIRRFILFHEKRHPAEMGKAEVTRFLSHLAVEAKVSASTQNQALSALLFLYGQVLNQELVVVWRTAQSPGHSALGLRRSRGTVGQSTCKAPRAGDWAGIPRNVPLPPSDHEHPPGWEQRE